MSATQTGHSCSHGILLLHKFAKFSSILNCVMKIMIINVMICTQNLSKFSDIAQMLKKEKHSLQKV